jgi:hypothetical protein
MLGGFDDRVDDAAPGRLSPPHGAADRHRFSGDTAGNGMALVLAVGVHHPSHHLLVGAHVRRGHIHLRADEI